MKGLVVIPAFNEGKVIHKVISKIPKRIHGLKIDFIVVNDGSTDSTEKVLKEYKVKFISHPINRGLGAALGTGFEYAKIKKYDFLITLDADGQHDPSEITNMFYHLTKSDADFVLGTRVYKKGMPISRRIITFLASIVTFILTGIWTTDSQSGLRLFSKRAMNLIKIEVDRMEISSDFFRQCKEKSLKIIEVPIKPIYSRYSLAKGQNFFNSFNIAGKLALKMLTR